MKYYKAFNRDMTCKGHQYAEGQEYKMDSAPVLCVRGYHFCTELALTLGYYPVHNDNKYAEVEVLGDVIFEYPTQHKGVTNHIKIVKILSDDEVQNILHTDENSLYNSGRGNTGSKNPGHHNTGNCNSGSKNSGHFNSGCRNAGDNNSGDNNSGNLNIGNHNSGHSNSGDHNSGYYNGGSSNSGYYNSGDRNTGHWNSCHNSTGFFNSVTDDIIKVFNKPCKRDIWNAAPKPDFLHFHIEVGETYQQAFQRSYNAASAEDKKMVLKLPNFDANVFFDISGIDVRETT